jgi:protein disulfide-isomerase
MRFLPLTLLLGAARWATAVASEAEVEEDLTRENTYFNAIKVPPLLELTPDNWDAELKVSKLLLVKHYR